MQYLARPQTGSNESDDALFFQSYLDVIRNRNESLWRSQQFARRDAMLGLSSSSMAIPVGNFVSQEPRIPTEDEFAIPIASLRAARRGAFDAGDTAESYLALADVYGQMSGLPESSPGENALQELTALTRYLARCPQRGNITTDDRASREVAPMAIRACFRAASLLMRPRNVSLPMIEQAHQHLLMAKDYMALDDRFFPDPVVCFELRTKFRLTEDLHSRSGYRFTFTQDPDWQLFLNPKRQNEGQVWFETLNRTLGEFGINMQQEGYQQMQAAAVKGEKALTQESYRAAIDRLIKDLGEFKQSRIDAVLTGLARAKLPDRTPCLLATRPGNTAADSLKKEMGNETSIPGDVYAQMIAVLIESGQLEQAAIDLKLLKEKVDLESDKKPELDLESLRQRIKRLEFLRARLEGNYNLAGVLSEELQGKSFQNLRPQQLEQLKTIPGCQSGAFNAVMGLILGDYHSNEVQKVLQALVMEGSYHFDRGFLALVAGDMPMALASFEKSLKPQNVDMKNYPVQYYGLAVQYIKLIKKYDSPAKAK